MQLYKSTGLNVYMYGISDNMSGVTNWIFYFQRCHDFFVFIWAQLLYRARLKNRKCFLFKWYNLIPPHMYLYSRTLCYRAIYSKACAHFCTESAHVIVLKTLHIDSFFCVENYASIFNILDCKLQFKRGVTLLAIPHTPGYKICIYQWNLPTDCLNLFKKL